MLEFCTALYTSSGVRPYLASMAGFTLISYTFAAAEGRDVGHAGHRFQLPLHHPVLNGQQLVGAAAGAALHRVAENLARGAVGRLHVRVAAVGQVHAAQQVVHLLPGEEIVHAVLKIYLDHRQAKQLVLRMLLFICTEFMAISMGVVTNFSISSAERPGHCVTMIIWVLVTSGNASMGVCR